MVVPSCACYIRVVESREKGGGERTTARMMVKSSHQKAWTIHTLVKMRKPRTKRTIARKTAVRMMMGGPQLPSVPMTERFEAAVGIRAGGC